MHSGGDATVARAALAHAKLQRTVASWLPPPTEEELREERLEERAREKEEEAAFKPSSDASQLLGVGATATDKPDGILGGVQQLSANEKLRRLLQGKDAAKRHASARKTGAGHGASFETGRRHKSVVAARPPIEDEEEDIGRSALGKSGRKQASGEAREPDNDTSGISNDHEARNREQGAGESRKSKRTTSYLDEILEQRERKRKKKQKRKENKSNT